MPAQGRKVAQNPAQVRFAWGARITAPTPDTLPPIANCSPRTPQLSATPDASHPQQSQHAPTPGAAVHTVRDFRFSSFPRMRESRVSAGTVRPLDPSFPRMRESSRLLKRMDTRFRGYDGKSQVSESPAVIVWVGIAVVCRSHTSLIRSGTSHRQCLRCRACLTRCVDPSHAPIHEQCETESRGRMPGIGTGRIRLNSCRDW